MPILKCSVLEKRYKLSKFDTKKSAGLYPTSQAPLEYNLDKFIYTNEWMNEQVSEEKERKKERKRCKESKS